MRRDDFTEKAPGKLVKLPSSFYAFVPNPLPPALSLDMEAIAALERTAAALSALDGAMQMEKNLPGPDLLINPYLNLEAVESSIIEGVQATLSDIMQYETESPKEMGKVGDEDIQEVENYKTALDNALSGIGDGLTLDLIKDIHRDLVEGVRGNKGPGEFRVVQNWIGPPGAGLMYASYVPPPPDAVISCMDELEGYLAESGEAPELIKAALIHYQFEAIHPFNDGNGRVGRILILLALIRGGLLAKPILNLSGYFEANRYEYYERLRSVSLKGEWEYWIVYFLEGVRQQSEAGLAMFRAAATIRDEYYEVMRAARAPDDVFKAIDYLFVNPYLRKNNLVERAGLNYSAASRAVQRMLDAGILSAVGDRKRDVIYRADRLADLFEGRGGR